VDMIATKRIAGDITGTAGEARLPCPHARDPE
jgi:hypothetical protein